MDSSPTVQLEARGGARVIRIDRPARRNALDPATLREIARVARAAGRDRSARGIVLTGSGEAFAAGGDLREIAKWTSAAGGRRLARLGRDAVDALRTTGLPVVAAVNGDAHGGGCELAAGCDVRVIERHARLYWAQGRFAVTTGWGGTARLVALVGPAVATRWLLGMAAVSAEDALAAGFADTLAEPGGSVEAACALVEQWSAGSRATVRRHLALIRGCAGQSFDEARAAELREFAAAWASREHREAVERFLARPRRG